ncbi:Exodeoxyribonuclease 7 large subunit [compost metagenome]
MGNLYEAFLRLKEKLAQAGLFDTERKRPIPSHARTIGVITSLQAAAMRDVLTTLQRRAPHVPVIVYPVPVQGAGAAERSPPCSILPVRGANATC